MILVNPVLKQNCYFVSTRFPLLFTLFSVIFLYILQYPAGRLFFEVPPVNNSLDDWLIAYVFVIYSSIILLLFIYIGIRGRAVLIDPPLVSFCKTKNRIALITVIAIILLFFFWSYLMRDLKIGMTIYADFDPLPFRMIGILFYGRLIVQPLVLAYIASSYRDSSRIRKALVLFLFVGLGSWAALTSGSRLIAIMFSLPLLLLFRGKASILVFTFIAGLLITIASLTRHFYLPFFISSEYEAIYANSIYQENMLSSLPLLAVGYFVQRTMGISEVLLTFDFGEISSSFYDSFVSLLVFFLPLSLEYSVGSIKNVYGLDDDAFGGFGLGLFPNYWVLLGGNLLTYSVGIAISAFLLGRCHRILSIALARFGFMDGTPIIFIMLFMFLFEARSHILMSTLLIGCFFARRSTVKLLSSIFKRRQAQFSRVPVSDA